MSTQFGDKYRKCGHASPKRPCVSNTSKDKSSAEASVRFAETWIIAALRDCKFFFLKEVNEAVAEKLEELNSREFQQRTGTRRSAYLEEEQPYMLPLPATPFEAAV